MYDTEKKAWIHESGKIFGPCKILKNLKNIACQEFGFKEKLPFH